MTISSRLYRPALFKEVLGQEPVVRALKNAISSKRLAQAYLFSGERGTGKTTLARLLAKALNCSSLSAEGEPCNLCSSCREIMGGSSMEVIEMDGASHRGIEDIRGINEGIAFRVHPESYKVVIVDEVHMLTKEAFSALLKTLEEPPPRTLFIFATTEAHRVLPTIISRCQRFHLQRIPRQLVMNKLQRIAEEQRISVEPQALDRIAERAEGGMRDAESLFDQVVAFSEGLVTEKSVEEVFGLPSRELYSQLDRAVEEGDFPFAFRLVDELFQGGKHLIHFFEGLVDHLRTHVRQHLSGKGGAPYRKEQALSLFSELVKRLDLLRQAHHPKVFLEETLLYIIRSRYLLPVDLLVKRLEALEKGGDSSAMGVAPLAPPKVESLLEKSPPVARPLPLPPRPLERGEIAPPLEAPKESQSFSPREETLLQFAAVELEGTLRRLR